GHELDEEAQDRDAVDGAEVHQAALLPLPYERVIVVSPLATLSPTWRRRVQRRSRYGVVMRKKRMMAWRTSTNSAGMPAEICISGAPARIPPKNSAARTMPRGLERP